MLFHVVEKPTTKTTCINICYLNRSYHQCRKVLGFFILYDDIARSMLSYSRKIVRGIDRRIHLWYGPSSRTWELIPFTIIQSWFAYRQLLSLFYWNEVTCNLLPITHHFSNICLASKTHSVNAVFSNSMKMQIVWGTRALFTQVSIRAFSPPSFNN